MRFFQYNLHLCAVQDEDEVASGRSGEEDYVLKQAFSALVPAFDPRPGRTNVPQIQDFHVPSPGSEDTGNASNQIPAPSLANGIKLSLSIRVRVQIRGSGDGSCLWNNIAMTVLLTK